MMSEGHNTKEEPICDLHKLNRKYYEKLHRTPFGKRQCQTGAFDEINVTFLDVFCISEYLLLLVYGSM